MSITAQLEADLSVLSTTLNTGPHFLADIPPLEVSLSGEGNYTTLEATLPILEFEGTVGLRAELLADLSSLESALYSGNNLNLDIPIQEFIATGLIGITSSFDIDLPEVDTTNYCGALTADLLLPPIDAIFTATVNNSARLVVSMPAISSLFTANVEQLAQLSAELPNLLFSATSKQEVIGILNANLSALLSQFEVSTGIISTFDINLPELEALFTSFNDLSADLITTLPIFWCELEGDHPGRFDTDTEAALDATILKYARPQ